MGLGTGESGQQPETRFTPFDIWEKGHLTEHLGGIHATQRLVRRCQLSAGQHVLDIGCGTGYTACYLARTYQARVVALDVNRQSVAGARERVSREGAITQVRVTEADARRLPFPTSTFDAVLAESVLVFCDATAVVHEIHRVLKPGGVVGANELTLLRPPPAQLLALLNGTMGIQSFQRDGWEAIYVAAGFQNVVSSVHRLNLWEQLVSHLRVDGLRGYLGAVVAGVRDATIRRTFFNRQMLAGARQFLPCIGYGLYTGSKQLPAQ